MTASLRHRSPLIEIISEKFNRTIIGFKSPESFLQPATVSAMYLLIHWIISSCQRLSVETSDRESYENLQ